MGLQNVTGVGVASLLGLIPLIGLLGGSESLLGGCSSAIRGCLSVRRVCDLPGDGPHLRSLLDFFPASAVSAPWEQRPQPETTRPMSNMAAMPQTYRPAHRAFIIVLLVSGFFVDISNALAIQPFLN
jgi:hypothetical protein